MIRFEAATKAYPRDGTALVAVDALDLEVRRGETLCLIGASGCGKTTTLRMVNRLVTPTGGRILFDGQDVTAIEPSRLRRRMGYVVQSGALFPHLDVAHNIGLLCRLEGWSDERIEARVDELLELVHLPPGAFRARFPAELSGGQRQRVGVARALALDPESLLMDEPFGALDPITRAQLQDEFRELESRVAKTTILVTHDMPEAFLLGDRVALMDAGRLLQVGTEDEFRNSPRDEHVARFVSRHLHG